MTKIQKSNQNKVLKKIKKNGTELTLKFGPNSKVELRLNSKTLIGTKLKRSNWYKAQKLKLGQNLKTQIRTKLRLAQNSKTKN